MGTGGYVAIGIGVLALAVVAYFVISGSGTATTKQATTAPASGGVATTSQTIDDGIKTLGKLADFGSKISDAVS